MKDLNIISLEDARRLASKRAFSTLVKPAGAACNLRCKYCYYIDKSSLLGSSSPGRRMELPLLEKYIADYFHKHDAVKRFMDGEIAFCKENGYTKTIMGRKRYIHEINSSNYMTRNLGERLAMNSPIQGSAADIIKIAMIRVYRELKEKNYRSKLILQVHDELIIKADRDEKERIEELLIRNMEEAMQLKVKLESDLNTGETWYELK